MAVEPWVSASLATDHYFLEPAGYRARARSAGGPRHSFGVVLGVVWILIFQLRSIPMMRMGAAPFLFATEGLMGGREAMGAWLRQWPQSIQTTLIFFFVLFWAEGSAAQGVDCSRCLCRHLRAAARAEQHLHGGGVAHADSRLLPLPC